MTTILIILSLAILFTFAYATVRAAPWVPTRKKDVQRFIDLVEIESGQIVYDIGCGDGRLVEAAASKGANSIGLEISLFPYILAHIRRIFSTSKKQISIKYRDFWRTDLSKADVVYFFLMPEVFDKLTNKFKKELKPGTKVVSYVWPIKGWTYQKKLEASSGHSLYLYQI